MTYAQLKWYGVPEDEARDVDAKSREAVARETRRKGIARLNQLRLEREAKEGKPVFSSSALLGPMF